MKTVALSIMCGIGGLVLGAMVGFLLWFFVTLFIEAGHGTYFPAKLLFPYTIAATRWTHEITATSIVAGYVLYSAYGLVLGLALPTSQRKKVSAIIGAIHAIAFVACLALADSGF